MRRAFEPDSSATGRCAIRPMRQGTNAFASELDKDQDLLHRCREGLEDRQGYTAKPSLPCGDPADHQSFCRRLANLALHAEINVPTAWSDTRIGRTDGMEEHGKLGPTTTERGETRVAADQPPRDLPEDR